MRRACDSNPKDVFLWQVFSTSQVATEKEFPIAKIPGRVPEYNSARSPIPLDVCRRFSLSQEGFVFVYSILRSLLG